MTNHNDHDLSPRDAAALLRAARLNADDDAIDRAVIALPDSRSARRLKIEQLLRAGDTGAADALIAQTRLPWPAHPALARLHAHSLLMQGDTLGADSEIRSALRARPHHVRTLLLGGRIARAAGDLPTAVRRFEEALRVRPRSDSVRRRLIETLIESGSIERAEELIGSLRTPCPVLDAGLLTAQGRLLDAVQRLQSVPPDAPEATRDAAMILLIELREHIGNVPRLMELLSTITDAHPNRLVAAGRAWLAAGHARTALLRLFHLRRSRPGPVHRRALAIMLVAAAMLDHPRLATRLLARLQRSGPGADPRYLADLWRRALTAQALRDPLHVACEEQAGRDVLTPLIESAIDTFGARPRTRGHDPHAEHLAVLLAATGRPDAAREVLARVRDEQTITAPEAQPTLRRAA